MKVICKLDDYRLLNAALILGILCVFWLSLDMGDIDISVIKGIQDYIKGVSSADALIVTEIRMPRTLLALFVGAALGLAGGAIQGLLRNPLADPGLIGAAQGAALGAATVFYYGFLASLGVLATAVAGLIGAFLTLLVMWGLSGSGRPSLVILAGLAVSTLAGALLAVLLNFAPNPFAMQELVFWLLGSVANRGFESVYIMMAALCLGVWIIISQKRLFAALTLGEQVAASLGVSVAKASRWVIVGCAILIGSAVSVAGNIGFVGLLAPHIIRPLVAHRPERLLVPVTLFSGLLVLSADFMVRLMPPDRELKLGVLTTLLGTPLFLWLIYKERKNWL